MKLFLSLLFLAARSYAALPGDTVWEVRTAGNANNGGCFVTSGTGTDYSQQNAAQYSFTDLVLVTTTTASSASHAFDASDVGNCLHITDGTGFTQGFYQIVSVLAGVATLDAAAGTMGSTGGTFAVGGAVALPQTAVAAVTNFNIVWVRADGTYSVTATTQVGARAGIRISGYTTTRGDGGSATIQAGANSMNILTANGASLFGQFTENLILDCASRTAVTAINTDNGSKTFYNIVATNCTTTAIILGNNGASVCYYCRVTGQIGGTSFSITNRGLCYFCTVTSPTSTTGAAFTLSGATATCQICIGVGHASATSVDVFALNANGAWVDHSVCYTSGRDCFRFTCGANCPAFGVTNSIAFDATGICFNNAGGSNAPNYYANFNAYGDCGTDYSSWTAGSGDVALSADPFTSAPTDFSLNSTAGGGAALKGVGYPGNIGIGTGFADIGALQSQGASSAGFVFGTTN